MSDNPASHQIIADLLRARTGQHLGPDRMWRISGALSGVFRRHAISNVDQLVCLLADSTSGDLADETVEALLNNETYFFRDRQSFDAVAEQALPRLRELRADEKRLRVWSAGCSSGQELYSIAMLLRSQGERWRGWSFDLLGTDVSQRIVSQARKGEYSQFEVQRGLTVAQMLAYFQQRETGWMPQADLKGMMSFRRHNLLDPPPQERPFDLVLCRNVLLYFDQATRQKVFDRLHEAAAPDGFLMLGAGETTVGQTTLFDPLNDGTGLFHPVAAAAHASRKRA
ncbi:CheR family methyltransferase [Erythrobacter litoralis]|uniref:Protein-glutamate O-methyltransferase n=1 Tax=Erythrobacter litoralis (strain HTCC2594) TaxID=314225 RepID=Q2N7K0_ERYLH|nr:protein-glutamate O-methyltransferase CheR [Erythrobacter litoralis]ABC64341.1 protein-glutamate O-methyltransferase [Erythrobacter litoralis HTCC2594]